MAVTIDYSTKVITVQQADLTFISGSLYEMDVNWFRMQLNDIADSEEGIPHATTHEHNTEVTIVGTTLARQVLIINGYSVKFMPDSQWSVRLTGANTDLFDVETNKLVQNQVHVISANSAGLISGQDIATTLTLLEQKIDLLNKLQRNKLITDPTTGLATLYDDDGTTILLQAQYYEDVNAAQTYRGQGAERRERFE